MKDETVGEKVALAGGLRLKQGETMMAFRRLTRNSARLGPKTKAKIRVTAADVRASREAPPPVVEEDDDEPEVVVEIPSPPPPKTPPRKES